MSSREREVYQLFALAEAGVGRVRLRAPCIPGTPPACLETDGFEMSTEDAMYLAPIPHDLPRGQTCRCTYRPVGDRPRDADWR